MTTLFSKGIQKESAKYLNKLFTLTVTFNSSLHTLIVTPFWINALKRVCLREYWIKVVDKSA